MLNMACFDGGRRCTFMEHGAECGAAQPSWSCSAAWIHWAAACMHTQQIDKQLPMHCHWRSLFLLLIKCCFFSFHAWDRDLFPDVVDEFCTVGKIHSSLNMHDMHEFDLASSWPFVKLPLHMLRSEMKSTARSMSYVCKCKSHSFPMETFWNVECAQKQFQHVVL
jgi:hypothetical protein